MSKEPSLNVGQWEVAPDDRRFIHSPAQTFWYPAVLAVAVINPRR